MKTYFIAGGAGFIGSNLIKKIFNIEKKCKVIVYDNLSSGTIYHLQDVLRYNIEIIEGDIENLSLLTESMKGSDVVYHFASNPDISKSIKRPSIDFYKGTFLTNNILESIRINKIKRLLYASGSGVYGNTSYVKVKEDYPFKLPISTYGASKLSCESMICSYSSMFDIKSSIFRFANVVGPNQTHGVGYDFINKLLNNNRELLILGNGKQSKSYIYIDDVINALMLIEKKQIKNFDYFNVATKDSITVTEIANIVKKTMNLNNVKYIYSGGNVGWKGDVPVIKLDSLKIRKFGWNNQYTSKDSIIKSINLMYNRILETRI